MSVVDAGSHDAATAARLAEVVVRRPDSQAELRAVSAVLAGIWQVPEERSPGPVNVLTALIDTGGYVAGAWRGDALIGASFGLTYLDGGRPCLRSQVTGSVVRGGGVGTALKLHQREWAAAAGLDRITWTFDPLVWRNGRFNLHHLGARIVRYVPDFYGSLDDGVNGSFPTDRCVVAWPTASDAAASRVASPASAAAPILVVDRADDDAPRVVGAVAGRDEPVGIGTPRDVVGLRVHRPDVATAWSLAVKDAMIDALSAGLVGVDVSPAGVYRFDAVADSRVDRDASIAPGPDTDHG